MISKEFPRVRACVLQQQPQTNPPPASWVPSFFPNSLLCQGNLHFSHCQREFPGLKASGGLDALYNLLHWDTQQTDPTDITLGQRSWCWSCGQMGSWGSCIQE